MTIGTILTLIQLNSLGMGISWKWPMLEMPTLLTRMETSIFSSSLTILQKKPYSWQRVKSARMHLVQISLIPLTFFRASSILAELRAIIQILKPNAASSSQKPSPIPSLPPVTTAHVCAPYLCMQFLLGRIDFTKAQSSLAKNTTKQSPPMTARKQMKFKVDSSIQQQQSCSGI